MMDVNVRRPPDVRLRGMRVAVVGHTEWIDFLRIPRVPLAGDITQASRAWAEPGGGGGVAAQQLARLAGSCSFFTALGDDGIGHRTIRELEGRGVRVHAAWRPPPHRRGVTFTDDQGERTITLFTPKVTPRGDDPLPWAELDGVDAVYFTGRDAEALREARRAKVLVATARELPTIREAGIEVDAIVSSANDPSERYEAVEPPPRLVVATRGTLGGDWRTPAERGTYDAVAPPGPVVDTYGAGDCFAAGLTFALGRGDPPADALAFAARCGAYAVTGPGVHPMPPAG
jgi:ribokinase